MKIKRICMGLFPAVAMVLLILDSKTASTAAQDGIRLCLNNVVPSLFPFFILSGLVMDALWGQNLQLLTVFGRIFHLPEGAETLLIPAFLGGYPVGAQSVAVAFRNHQIEKEEAHRLLAFCSNPGPAFIFGILSNCFDNPKIIWAVWGTQILSAILLSALYPRKQQKALIPSKEPRSISQILTETIGIMAQICGWVILFRIIIAFEERWFFWLFPKEWQVILSGIMELTNGCCRLNLLNNPELKFMICCGMLSFGGICVSMQVSAIMGDLSFLCYLHGQLLQCLLSVIIAGVLCGKPACFFLLLFSVTLSFLRNIKNNSRIPNRIHV